MSIPLAEFQNIVNSILCKKYNQVKEKQIELELEHIEEPEKKEVRKKEIEDLFEKLTPKCPSMYLKNFIIKYGLLSNKILDKELKDKVLPYCEFFNGKNKLAILKLSNNEYIHFFV